MVSAIVAGMGALDPTDDSRPNVDPDRVHFVFTPWELARVIAALRGTGNIELAERLAGVLFNVGQGSRP
ncbi:MAG: hypothetical protein JO023_02150 [Chloroflexi bacterium]|nr:hypothetical protein [Chloroflexota bacterium]